MNQHLLRTLPFLLGSLLPAQAPPAMPATQLRVKELTAFKDGHAFVLRAGDAALGKDGKVRLDDLPKPLLGTFWPAVRGDGCRLRSVTSGQRRVEVQRTALELRQLLAGNIGARVVVHETENVRYTATVLGLPQRPPAELEAHGAEAPAVAQAGDVVLLRSEASVRGDKGEKVADAGVRLVRLDRIVDVTFLDEPKTGYTDQQVQPQLVLDVACTGAPPATVPVELAWVEHGFRWIPSYRVVIDGKGQAVVTLQATLVNDLVDLEDANVHLVVGVPSFAGKGQLDPIALQAAMAAAARNAHGQTQTLFNNAIMTQAVASNYVNDTQYAAPVEPGEPAGGAEGRKEQDLYVFTVSGITLRARDRMVVSLGETTLPYRDVWQLDVPVSPPREWWDRGQQDPTAFARMLAAPKVKHLLRLENRGIAPFTTGPALCLQAGQVLAQGLMTYTPVGNTCDLELTTAIDILVKKSDQEQKRTPNSLLWNSNHYMLVDLEGKLRLANRRGAAVDVEVRRTVFGKLTAVGQGGSQVQLDTYDDEAFDQLLGSRGRWYGLWSTVLNGIGRATWTVHLEPGQEAEVTCNWQYYWQT